MSLSEALGDRILRMGSTGSVVRQMQLGLRAVGYALNGTGYFGPATDTAVSAFQKRAGLRPDGEVGQDTAKAIDAAQAAPVVAQQASKAEIGRPLWVEAGIKLIGTTEAPGARDNPVIIQWAKDLGGNIAKQYTHDSIPWCALGMNHFFSLVGIKATGTLWAMDFAGKWPSIRLPGPAVGAVAPMLRNGGGHVTCIVGKDQRGNPMGLGCNQADAVNIEPFAISRLNQGFWWPKDVPAPANVGLSALPIIRSDGRLSSGEA